MMAETNPVIVERAYTSGERPKRIRIPDAKQRRDPGIGPNVRRGRAAGAIGAGQQADRLAV